MHSERAHNLFCFWEAILANFLFVFGVRPYVCSIDAIMDPKLAFCFGESSIERPLGVAAAKNGLFDWRVERGEEDSPASEVGGDAWRLGPMMFAVAKWSWQQFQNFRKFSKNLSKTKFVWWVRVAYLSREVKNILLRPGGNFWAPLVRFLNNHKETQGEKLEIC